MPLQGPGVNNCVHCAFHCDEILRTPPCPRRNQDQAGVATAYDNEHCHGAKKEGPSEQAIETALKEVSNSR